MLDERRFLFVGTRLYQYIPGLYSWIRVSLQLDTGAGSGGLPLRRNNPSEQVKGERLVVAQLPEAQR